MQQAFKIHLMNAEQNIEYAAYMNDHNTVGKFVVERLRANSRIEAESAALGLERQFV
jgi:hypothetical protein